MVQIRDVNSGGECGGSGEVDEPGVNAQVVRELIGHSLVSFTLDTCGHVMPAQQSEAAQASLCWSVAQAVAFGRSLLADARSSSMARRGMTIRRPSRIDGIEPSRTHS